MNEQNRLLARIPEGKPGNNILSTAEVAFGNLGIIESRGRPMPIRYELIIDWSPEGQAYVASVPEIPGCMADGSAYHQKVVIGEWIQTAKKRGRPIHEPWERLMCMTDNEREHGSPDHLKSPSRIYDERMRL